MEEKIYLKDNQITITSSRVLIGNTTYTLRNISSVKKAIIKPKRLLEICLMLIGLFSISLGILSSSSRICLGIGFVFGVVGGVISYGNRIKFVVQLGTNAGEKNALSSEKEEYVNNIVESINNAIIEYR